jgi:hypothetical protein
MASRDIGDEARAVEVVGEYGNDFMTLAITSDEVALSLDVRIRPRDPHRGQDRTAPRTSIRPASACYPATAGRSPAPALLGGCSSGSRLLPGKTATRYAGRQSATRVSERPDLFGRRDVEGGLRAPTHGCEARSAPDWRGVET